MRLTAPDGWVRKPRRSGFLLAEFALPRAEGDQADGRLTVTAVGGSVEENVERWRQQFEGGPKQESQETIEVAGVPITVVDFAGAYGDQHASLGSATPSSGYRMQAALFHVGGQQFIVKCYGPEKTMAGHADGFLEFLRSLKSAEAEATDPESTDPESTDPESTEPKSTDPESTEPKSTDPESTEPKVTEPKVTEPEVPEPKVPEPKVPEPEVPEPESTDSP